MSISIISSALFFCLFQPPSYSAECCNEYTSTLFDGRTLAGWTVENSCQVAVRDGMIVLESGDGWLRSDHMYGDFRLHIESFAMQTEGYDAGIYLRALPGGAPFPEQGYQSNLQQGKEGNIASLSGATSSGLAFPAGHWNRFDITVIGDTVEMAINGCCAYRAAGLSIARGHVGIQIEVPQGGQFCFRNIWITEIGYRGLFNGCDFTNWEGANEPAESCWKVEDGLLQCTGERGTWLRSHLQYADFNFRLEYLLPEGGNSGIYVRVPEDGNHHRENDTLPPAGFEVQLLDDAAAKHRELKDYQYSGSVYDIAGANPRVSKPAGEWNTIEVNCLGQHIVCIHNGVKIIDATPDEYPPLALRKTQGFLGLQNHSSAVKFRNLRIGPAVDWSTVMNEEQ